MPSNIPYARQLVSWTLDYENLTMLQRAYLTRALELMKRAPPIRVAPRRSRMNAQTVAFIKRRARETPDTPQQWIAQQAGVSSGRVSEVLNGLRDKNGKRIRA